MITIKGRLTRIDFNSTTVRLEEKESLAFDSSLIHFNSTTVRLEALNRWKQDHKEFYFNSTTVRLEAHWLNQYSPSKNISIPLRYD
ncbi:hypothetical protein GK108_13895 [Spirosoma terrae]|uniref:Uncharacterized protein n=1 Tax=Spirosoma terrae TaxID=1968276 RepID=A0A6L9L6D9_9BACT|nr:hypothetical protein [Spirosoma terrae]